MALVSSKVLISCKDEESCRNLRIITTRSDEIPRALSQYQSVESIDLHGNLLEGFSGSDVGRVGQLKALNLSYNLLSQGDVLRGVGYQLQEIDLTFNQLTWVTVPISVKKFIASRNKFTQVTFAGSNLEELVLSKNKLDRIPDVSKQTRLSELDLSCNEISEVGFGKFPNSLTYLNLANNRIYQTSGGKLLNSLQYLDLSNNILTIFDDSMDAVSNVQNLYLQKNEIVMITTKKRFSRLRNIDLRRNDWDCNSVKDFFKNHVQVRSESDNNGCAFGSIGASNLCCSTSSAPYADRVIRYRKRNHDALQNSSVLREHGVNCANYEPSPCDGDDNEVYRVAGAAANDIQTLVSQNNQKLQEVLEQQKSILQQKQQKKEMLDGENRKLQTSLTDLVGYIKDLYEKEGHQGQTDSAKQLKEIFEQRDFKNTATLDKVKGEELKLQNALTDISKVEEDLLDLNDRKERLLTDIQARNATVIEYERKIKELKVKLGRA